MNKDYENVHRYDFLTKELLEKEYLINKLTDRQIATKYGASSKAVIWQRRKKFNIKNRYLAKSNKHARKNRKYNLTKTKAEKILSQGKIQDIADYLGCSLIVAKRRLKELGLSKPQKHTERYKFYYIELSEDQKQFIIGSILGDGTIARHGAYSCSHSIKQSEYHKHKRKMLSSISSTTFQHAIHKAVGIDGNRYESLHFTTGCNKYCLKLREVYYPYGKKIFPYFFLLENMSAQALAYWYMDDGTYKIRDESAIFCTYGFSPLDQIAIKVLLEKKWNIKSNVRKERKRTGTAKFRFYQRLSKSESKKLFDLIRPYVVPSMRYKIGE